MMKFTYKEVDNILQWLGAGFIIAGHILNAVGPAAYPYNIMTFTGGIVLFLWWSIRVGNQAQITVNAVSLFIGLAGVVRMLFS